MIWTLIHYFYVEILCPTNSSTNVGDYPLHHLLTLPTSSDSDQKPPDSSVSTVTKNYYLT